MKLQPKHRRDPIAAFKLDILKQRELAARSVANVARKERRRRVLSC
jgi:hypothetical protein